nr:nucleotidyl transferase AbiEii/AbiGii toxin family protein [Aeromicrobium duanguangcaii]
MLPGESVVKGGVGIKLRLGEIGTRATTDFDVATREEEAFLDDLEKRLEIGWGTVPPSKGQLKKNAEATPRLAFTGALRRDKKSKPAGVPAEYVMKPCNVTLRFMTSPWSAVKLEVGYDELRGIDLADHETGLDEQLTAIGAILGFGDLKPVPLISLELQLAQKIHAVTEPGSPRAHDLVDLQLLWHAGTDAGQGLDLTLLKTLCERTFDFRKRHAWPPADFAMPGLLDDVYGKALDEARAAPEAVEGEPETVNATAELADTLADASAWLNDRIVEIVAAVNEADLA